MIPTRKTRCKWLALAAAVLLLSPLTKTTSAQDDYKILRGQPLNLKKPANAQTATPAREPVVGGPLIPPPAPAPTPVTPAAPAADTTGNRPQSIQGIPMSRVQRGPVAVPVLATVQPDTPKKDESTPARKEDTPAVPNSDVPSSDYKLNTSLPSLEELYRLESEKQFEKRIQMERGQVEFPKVVIETSTFKPRAFSRSGITVETHYVCHGKLLFEERNAERYGWDLGFIQPFVSTGIFYKDMFLLPYKMGSRPFRVQCSPQCLPGDQMPYMWYHEGFTISGFLTEAGTAVALFALFP